MSVPTSFAQFALVRTLALTGVEGRFHSNPAPFLEAVCNSFRVCVVENRPTQLFTASTALVVDSGIVPRVRVHPDGDGDHLARPAGAGTPTVVADKLAHDIAVIVLDARDVLIDIVEIEAQAM